VHFGFLRFLAVQQLVFMISIVYHVVEPVSALHNATSHNRAVALGDLVDHMFMCVGQYNMVLATEWLMICSWDGNLGHR